MLPTNKQTNKQMLLIIRVSLISDRTLVALILHTESVEISGQRIIIKLSEKAVVRRWALAKKNQLTTPNYTVHMLLRNIPHHPTR